MVASRSFGVLAGCVRGGPLSYRVGGSGRAISLLLRGFLAVVLGAGVLVLSESPVVAVRSDFDLSLNGTGVVSAPGGVVLPAPGTRFSVGSAGVGPSGVVTAGADWVRVQRFVESGAADLSYSGDGASDQLSVPAVVGFTRHTTVGLPGGATLFTFYKWLSSPSSSQVVLVRVNAAGDLDSSFGSGGVAVLSTPTCASFRNKQEVKVDSFGGVIFTADQSTASGCTGRTGYVMRVTPAGVYDSLWGTGGVKTFSGSLLVDVEPAEDGRVILFTESCAANPCSGSTTYRLVKYLPNGSVEPGFSSANQVSPSPASPPFDIMWRPANPNLSAPLNASGIALMAFGQIKFYTATGATDPNRVGSQIGGGFGSVRTQLAPNGQVYLSYPVFTGVAAGVRRLTQEGDPDPTYADDGREQAIIGTEYWVSSFFFDGKGRVVGTTNSNTHLFRFRSQVPVPVATPAADIVGASSVGGELVADPVNTATGNLTDSVTDLSMDAFGLSVTRTYNTFDASIGVLGERWRIGTGSSIAANGDGYRLTLADGSPFRFAPDGGGGWMVPDGLGARLSADPAPATGGGALPMLRVTFNDGHVERFDTTGRLIQQLGWDATSATSSYDGAGRLSTVTASTGGSITFGYDGAGKLVSLTPSNGTAVTYGYDGSGRLSTVTDNHGAVTAMTYTAQGWLETVTAPGGVVKMANTYDGAGRVIIQTGPSGGVTSFSYDIAKAVTTVGDSVTGSSVRYEHDSTGRVIAIVDAYGKRVDRSYDSGGNMNSVIDRLDLVGAAVFDANHNLLTSTVPGAGTTTYTYDTSNRMTSTTDPWAQTTTYTYTGGSRIPATITKPLGQTTTFNVVNGLVMSSTDADGVVLSFTYDTKRRPVTVTDAFNNVTTTVYDTQDRVTSTTAPSGRVTSYIYGTNNRLTSTTAPDGGVTSYTYDTAGRPLTVTDPTGAVTTNTYNSAGLLATETAPNGHVTTYTYNGNGDLVSTADAAGGTTTTSYAAQGRVTSTADELARSTSYAYNANGDTTSVTDPANAAVQTQYDSVGRPFKTIDAANRQTVTAYDTHGRVVSVTEPGNRVTSYGYDALGRVTTVTDARGGQTVTVYTPGGRTDTITDPAGLVTDYTYDLAGRVASIKAPGNLTTTYAYNPNSEIATITSPGGLVTSYAYDPAGRVTTITDPAGVVTTRTWSTRGQLLTEKVGAEGTVTHTYNPDRTIATVTDAVGNLTTFGYDNRSNLTSRTNAQGGIDAFTYNAANEFVSSADPLNRTTTYTYDPVGRLASATDPTGRTVTTTYNPDGTAASRAELNGPTTTFAYDTAGRLSGATDPTGTYGYAYEPGGQLATMFTPSGRVTKWSYDTAGRRTAITQPDGSSYKYIYDTAGRVASITPGELLADTFTATNNTTPEPPKWTIANTAGATATVQSNEARLQWTNTTNSATSITATPTAGQDHEVSYRYRFASTASTTVGTLITYLRNSASGNLRIEQTSNSTTAKIFKQVGTTSTQLGTFTVPVSTANKRIRVQLQGTTIKVRVWTDGTAEPTTWNSTLTTATGVTTAGQVKLTAKRASGTNDVFVDDYTQTNPTTPPAAIATYTYNADDQITNEALIGGTRTRTFTTGRLTNYTTTLPGLNQTTTLTYDTTGRINTENTGGITTTYGYDAASQLTSAIPSTGTANSWTYDNLGRPATQTIGATTTRNVYDTASQLCWSTTAALPANPTCATPAAGAITYTYDQAGRLLTDTTTPTNKVTYTYDTAGRQSTSQRINGATTTNQTRTYTPSNDLQSVVSGTTTVQLDWDPTQQISTLVTLVNASNTQSLAAGPSGWVSSRIGSTNVAIGQRYDRSVAPTTETSGLARSDSYSAFGTPAGIDTALPTLGYRGEVHIDGLIYLRNRNYQPGTTRFASVDPVPGRIATTTISNPYHYVDNNPLHNTDPLGLYSIDDSSIQKNGLPIWSIPVLVGAGGGAVAIEGGGTIVVGGVTGAGVAAAAVPTAIVGATVYTVWMGAKIPGAIADLNDVLDEIDRLNAQESAVNAKYDETIARLKAQGDLPPDFKRGDDVRKALEAAATAKRLLDTAIGGNNNQPPDTTNTCGAEEYSSSGRTFDEARREAFQNAFGDGWEENPAISASKFDPATGTAVEFKGPGGAKVGYDGPHPNTPGDCHDVNHISWQSAGKRGAGGQRGNIPYDGPQHPSRPGR